MRKLFLFLLVGLFAQLTFCGDLDDGIGINNGIKSGNDLQKETNTKFLIRKAKAKAQAGGSEDSIVLTDDGDGMNVGGVNMIGSNVKNVTIIQDIKGDVTNVSK